MAEQLVLDPTEVSTGRVQLDISPYVKADGADYGDAEIAATMADQERGSTPIDFRLPNRLITIPLVIKPITGTTFVQARQNLQKKVARIQQEGGWLRRTTSSGTLFADVVNATLKFGGDWLQANRGYDINAELHLECIPDWYGPEITLPDRIDTTNGDLIWTETGILGDYPGRLRLVVDEDQGQNQMGLLFGIRCRHYSNSTTAALRYFGSQLTPLDAATLTGGAILHSNLSTAWTAVTSTDISGVSLTHTGTYDVWARASSSSVNVPRLRLVWDVGDFALPTENAAVQLPGFNQTYPVNLGQVRLDRVPAGTHRWRGVIQAAGPAGGETVAIDRLWLVPVDEGYGVLRAPLTIDPGLNAYSARDEFNHTAGVLSGKALPAGGTWSGLGDTDDFVINATNHTAQRSSVSDTGPRVELAGTGVLSNVAAYTQVFHTAAGGSSGLIARYVDANNWLVLRAMSLQSATTPTIIQLGMVINTEQLLLDEIITLPMTTQALALQLTVDTAGRWAAYAGSANKLEVVGQGVRTELATGGVLATGRVGIYDRYMVSTPLTRQFDSFAAWSPATDAVLFANQSAELRTEGMFREDSTGTAFGPVSHVVGDLPRIPPSGSEGRTVQFFLKTSRGDFDTLPDTGVDDISARAFYRPSHLLTS